MRVQTVMHLQARCADSAIDENAICHGIVDTAVRLLMQGSSDCGLQGISDA
jgi:hypothetical protein